MRTAEEIVQVADLGNGVTVECVNDGHGGHRYRLIRDGAIHAEVDTLEAIVAALGHPASWHWPTGDKTVITAGSSSA